jgi:hypothetical protein
MRRVSEEGVLITVNSGEECLVALEFIFLSCSLAKEFGLAEKEFCRLAQESCSARKELYSATKESGRVRKEFGQAAEEFCRLAKELKSAKLLCGLPRKQFGQAELLCCRAQLLCSRVQFLSGRAKILGQRAVHVLYIRDEESKKDKIDAAVGSAQLYPIALPVQRNCFLPSKAGADQGQGR